MYSRVPKKRPPVIFFSKNFPTPPLLLGSLSPHLQEKKYLLSKKVISKISLKILSKYPRIMTYLQARRNEKNSGGSYQLYKIVGVGQRRKFFISNRLNRLEKQNLIFVGGRQCKFPSTTRNLLRNYFESVLKVSNLLQSLEV